MAYEYVVGGYWVNDGKVLLVHHKKFDKWTPPGGHMEENETPADTIIREFMEEVRLPVEVIPAAPAAFAGDDRITPIPLPFHMDLEAVDGFAVPTICYYYYVRPVNPDTELIHLEEELHGLGWFSKEDLKELKTFEQVRAVAAYALDHYPQTPPLQR